MTEVTPAQRRTERLLNLVICLLWTDRLLTKEDIYARVPGYDAEAAESRDKMFENDKKALRELGVPIVSDYLDHVHEDAFGYRIRKGDYQLPAITFEPDELGALALAGSVWTGATLSDSAAVAIRKFESEALERDDSALSRISPVIHTPDAAFDPMRAAVVAAQAVSFDYRKPRESAASKRRLQPWSLAHYKGRWYVVGHDMDRDDVRVFRLDRIASAVRKTGDPGAFTPPADLDAKALIARHSGGDEAAAGTAAVRVREGRGVALRQVATAVQPADDHDGWDLLSVPYRSISALAGEVAYCGPDAVAIEPAELRESVIQRLEAAVAHHTPGGAA